MNTEKKLEYFTQAIARDVESKKRQARQQMTNDFNNQVSDGVAHAHAEAKKRIAAEKQAIEKSVHKRITEATIEARRTLTVLREYLVAQLFNDIAIDVAAFTSTPEYENLLINNIQAALATSKHSYKYIQLTPADMGLSTRIHNDTGLTPEQGEASMLGGFRLLSANRGKAADCTFESGLAEARQEFSAELATLLSTQARHG